MNRETADKRIVYAIETRKVDNNETGKHWGIGTGVPLPNPLGGLGLGSVVSSLSGVRGGAPAANAFLALFEAHRTAHKKHKFSQKNHSIDRLGDMATGQSPPG